MGTNQGIAVAVVVIVALIILIAIAFGTSRKRRSARLRRRFGPEYDRVMQQEGDRRRAEGVLEFRQSRTKKYRVHGLSPRDRNNFMARWNEVQKRFVDDPQGAVIVADNLVTDVMQARGYEMGEFEQRADDLSVDYPVMVDNYRAAHAIVSRHGGGSPTTEDLRQAMMHYRLIFEELLEDPRERKGA